jgi:hypothetical protein
MQPVPFAAACILFRCTCSFYGMSFSHAAHRRTFHSITMLVTGISALCFLVLALAGGAWSYGDRQFFYIRYCECVRNLHLPGCSSGLNSAPPLRCRSASPRAPSVWAASLPGSLRNPPAPPPRYAALITPSTPLGSWMLTSPRLLLEIGLLAGASMPRIRHVLACNLLMVLSMAIGPAIFNSGSPYKKWPFFAVGCLWFLPILRAVAVEWSATVHNAVRITYTWLAYGSLALWTWYHVMWVLCEGLDLIPSEAEGEPCPFVLLFPNFNTAIRTTYTWLAYGTLASMK